MATAYHGTFACPIDFDHIWYAATPVWAPGEQPVPRRHGIPAADEYVVISVLNRTGAGFRSGYGEAAAVRIVYHLETKFFIVH